MRKDLLDKINSFADSLAKVSTWKNSKDAFGNIIEYKNGVEKVSQSDYIYEFYCYMKIIEDLNKKSNQNVKFIKGNGIFPRKPVIKKNRPYFILEVDNKEIFQICSGTQIQTKLKNIKKAPDISFQSITSDDDLPSYNDILAIYDAKYSESKKAISFQEGQMVLFNRMIRLLRQENPTNIEIYYTDYIDFKGNCLITNKKSYTTDIDELNEEKITVIEYFDEKQKFNAIK